MAKKNKKVEAEEEEEEEAAEEEVEAEATDAQADVRKAKPSLMEKMLTELTKKIAAQDKIISEIGKRLPKPTEEDDKRKAEEEAIAKKKMEDDESLATYKEILEEKFGITEGIESLAEAKIAMKVAKGNKLGLQTLSEKMKQDKGEQSGSGQSQKLKSYFDTSGLDAAIKKGE